MVYNSIKADKIFQLNYANKIALDWKGNVNRMRWHTNLLQTVGVDVYVNMNPPDIFEQHHHHNHNNPKADLLIIFKGQSYGLNYQELNRLRFND